MESWTIRSIILKIGRSASHLHVILHGLRFIIIVSSLVFRIEYWLLEEYGRTRGAGSGEGRTSASRRRCYQMVAGRRVVLVVLFFDVVLLLLLRALRGGAADAWHFGRTAATSLDRRRWNKAEFKF